MVDTIGDDDPTLTGDARILNRARKRFARCQNYYGDAYKNSLDDTKFANADDRNKHQWPNKIYADRDDQAKAVLHDQYRAAGQPFGDQRGFGE